MLTWHWLIILWIETQTDTSGIKSITVNFKGCPALTLETNLIFRSKTYRKLTLINPANAESLNVQDFYFVIIVAPDVLAHNGARPSAGTVMITKIPIFMTFLWLSIISKHSFWPDNVIGNGRWYIAQYSDTSCVLNTYYLTVTCIGPLSSCIHIKPIYISYNGCYRPNTMPNLLSVLVQYAYILYINGKQRYIVLRKNKKCIYTY